MACFKRLDKARLEVGDAVRPFHVAVHYQPESTATGSDCHQAWIPHDAGPAWSPLAVQTSSSSSEPQGKTVELDLLQLWLSGAMSDDQVRDALGQTLLDWYKRLKAEMEASGVEGANA